MSTLRIIDANANRAREALRVMEEAARFVLEDAELSAALKQTRHDLREALPAEAALVVHRDTPGDVGTGLTTTGETARGGTPDVAAAAGKRLSEALRALEEYGKTTPGCDTPALKQLRYRGYELERQLNAALAGRRRRRQWRLCVLLTRSLCALPWEQVLEEVIDAGADCIQVREKQMEAGGLLAHAGEVVRRSREPNRAERCRPAVSVIVNDRPDIALLAGADGVHLGQHDLPAAQARGLVGAELLVGVSTSNLDQARAAKDAGADYCGVGPMFTTTTKDKPELAGPTYLRDYLNWGALPHLAIGGIAPDNIGALAQAGARGVAVCGAVCASDQPGDAVRALLQALPPAAEA